MSTVVDLHATSQEAFDAADHLEPVTLERAQRRLTAKAIGELTHERLLSPTPVPDAADRPVLAAAAAAAPALDWDADPWHALTAAVKAATGAKGRALFLPLRRALTGRDHGPDMAELLPLITKDQAIARLSIS